MTSTSLDQAELANFQGGDPLCRFSPLTKVVCTQGAKYVAERGGAWWLLDRIAFAQLEETIAEQPFQVWDLTVTGRRAQLRCSDGDDNTVYRDDIHITDFPEPGIQLWFSANVILLPSEW